jgi:DNA-binding transcriptional regulator PaaX
MNDMAKRRHSAQPATTQILLALIPYSKRNLQLTFHPSKFFDELEKTSGLKRLTLQQSYARLKQRGLITDTRTPKLTAKGKEQVQPYVAEKLDDGKQLMVIFDIPEDFGEHRRQLRNLLRHLGFTQVQRSVWVSSHDHKQVVKEAVADLKVNGWVELFETKKLS